MLRFDELASGVQYFEAKHRVIDQSYVQLKDVVGNLLETSVIVLREVRQ